MRVVGDESIHLQSENRAMHDEVVHLSSQLAMRTVMFKALTNKFHDETRLHTSLFSDKERENIELNAKLAQLTAQYDACIKEKTEIEFSYRETVEIKSTLEQQLIQAKEEQSILAEDLDHAVTNNRQIQAELNIYKNSDPEDVQTRLAEEAAEIKRTAAIQRDQLLRQLNDSQRQVSRLAEERERLQETVQELVAEVDEKDHLLHQLGHSGRGSAERSGASVNVNGEQSRSLFHFSDSSIHQQQHLQDEAISQLSVLSNSPSTKAGARYASTNTGNNAAAGSNGPGTDALRASTDTIESSASSGSWSIGHMGEAHHLHGQQGNHHGGDQGDESDVLQASREGLPPGIAYQSAQVAEHADVNSALQRLLTVLESLAEGLQSAAPDHQSLSQVAQHAVSQLIHSDLFTASDIDIDSSLSESLQNAVGRLLKQLMTAVHTHLGAPTEAEEAHSFSGTHTHVHFATPDVPIRRHQISFEEGHSTSKRNEVEEEEREKEETEGQEKGKDLPHRHQSNDASLEELVRIKHQCKSYLHM